MALQKLEAFETILLLEGSGMSRRGIRVRVLAPDEKRKADLDGWALAKGTELSNAAVSMMRGREGVKKMLVAVTDTAGYKDYDALIKAPPSDWHQLSDQQLENDADYALDGPHLFTTRDREFIDGVYNQLHSVMKDEFDELMGKAVKADAHPRSASSGTASSGTAT